ncbi:hypothetical protein SAMN02745127_00208 [Oceanospirillum multiglobuliferum]|uniref:Sortilin N-terminal domain-containing protein n=1 Tax=Oceanospirillum multiglobuliferum TaxID=64969 RepID=A0A1T4KT64_9GAMM|nr:hypothetical protein [Oceanospirillum multiglobuliferum]OPX54932.1 hypothetical protein BTE48_11350 [Oceanospirillum multiglobuliferum]SJZ45606.1 hypothetical protein SAMN02745127_00208 [Oceanospirillum multiglobuliferum]
MECYSAIRKYIFNRKIATVYIFIMILSGCGDSSSNKESIPNIDQPPRDANSFYMDLSPNIQSVFDLSGVDEEGDLYYGIIIDKESAPDTMSISISQDGGSNFTKSDINAFDITDGFGYLYSSKSMKIVSSKLDMRCNCYNYRPTHHYSLDGGKSWQKLSVPSGAFYNFAHMDNPTNSIIAGGAYADVGSALIKTLNIGETWFNLEPYVLDSLVNAGIVDRSYISAKLKGYYLEMKMRSVSFSKSQCNDQRLWLSFTLPDLEEKGDDGTPKVYDVLAYSDDLTSDAWQIAYHGNLHPYYGSPSIDYIHESCTSGTVFFKSGAVKELNLSNGDIKEYPDNSRITGRVRVHPVSGDMFMYADGKLKRKEVDSDNFVTISPEIVNIANYSVHPEDSLRIAMTDVVNNLFYTKNGGKNWSKLPGDFTSLPSRIGSATGEGFNPIVPFFIPEREGYLLLILAKFYSGKEGEQHRVTSKGLYYLLPDVVE